MSRHGRYAISATALDNGKLHVKYVNKQETSECIGRAGMGW